MTESEWLACRDPGPMLEFLRGKVSDRKLRLFSVGCCRQIWHLLLDARAATAVEVAAQFADGHVGAEERMAARAALRPGDKPEISAVQSYAWDSARAATRAKGEVAARDALFFSVEAAARVAGDAAYSDRYAIARCKQVNLLRDIFGNPFQSNDFNSAWRTSTVVEVAQAIYEQHAFERLPVLGDALEEAGCSSPEILNHCRSEGVHVRGCFVVDGVLGKE